MVDVPSVKVVGRFGMTAADGVDADDEPDVIWCDSGTVRLKPLNSYTKVAGGTPSPWTAGHSIIEVPLDSEGHLTWSGARYIRVLDLTSPAVNPVIPANKATHSVEFKDIKAGGTIVSFDSVNVRLAADTVDPVTGVCDLTKLMPVPTAGGTPITRGEQGTGIASIALAPDGTGLVATMTDGTTKATALPAALVDSDAQVAAAVTGSGAARAALDARFSAQPDLIGAIRKPAYLSHRGGNLLFPEHSMEGYRASAAAGFVLEIDVSALGDGTLVCHHDDTLARTLVTKDGAATTGNISDLTREQFQNLRIKPKVPGQARAVPVLWEDLLAELGGRVPIMVEVKPGVSTQAVCDSITARGLQKSVQVASTLLTQCQTAVAAGLQAQLVTDMLGQPGQPTTSDVYAAGVRWLGCQSSVPTSYIAAAKAAGLMVATYTVNTRAGAATDLARGVDAIYTDDAWFLAGVEPEQAADPFARKTPWPHMVSTNAVYREEWSFTGTRSVRRTPPNATNYFSMLAMDWAGRRGPNVRIRWTANYATGAAGTTRQAGIAFGKWASADSTFKHDGSAGQQAYHFGAALNGELNMWRVDGASPVLLPGSLGSVAGADIAPGVDNQFEVVITPSDITFRNLTLGMVATDADTTIRPVGLLALTASLGVDFKDVWVETI